MRGLVLCGAVALAAASGCARADLYVWKDPATGTMKIYSYPPPWYGNPEREKRAPKVERIPERQRAPEVRPESTRFAEPPPAPQPEAVAVPPPPPVASASPLAPALLGPLDAQRKRLLGELAAMRDARDPGLMRRLEGYRDLVLQMDRIDPAGAQARAEDLRALIERMR